MSAKLWSAIVGTLVGTPPPPPPHTQKTPCCALLILSAPVECGSLSLDPSFADVLLLELQRCLSKHRCHLIPCGLCSRAGVCSNSQPRDIAARCEAAAVQSAGQHCSFWPARLHPSIERISKAPSTLNADVVEAPESTTPIIAIPTSPIVCHTALIACPCTRSVDLCPMYCLSTSTPTKPNKHFGCLM